MDIREALLKEHSKSQCKKIVDYIGADTKRFAELMTLFFEGEYRVTQRAAWPLSYCIEKNPLLIQPYFGRLFDMLQKPGVHNAVIRNIIRLLQYIEIPKRYHGKIMTICFEYITSENIPAAVKAFSLTVLHNLSRQYMEIQWELKLIIEERWDKETPAYRSRAKKILSRIG
jgi:hypothetical protein